MGSALVLAGGGARGAYQVGMLQRLIVEQGVDFQVIRGVSVGALNAAFLAQAPTSGDSLAALQKAVGDLHQLWTEELKGNHSVYGCRAGLAGVAVGADSLYTVGPLERLIKKHLSLEALKKSGRDFKVGTVSLVTGRYEEWSPKDSYFEKKLLASACIPVVFPFVDLKRAKDVLVDGGVRNITPLSSAFRDRPDEVYVLLANRMVREGQQLPDSNVREHDYAQWDDNWLGTRVGGLDVLKRTIEILTDEIYLDDIRGALDWNEVARAAEQVGKASEAPGAPPEVSQAVCRLTQSLEKVKKRPVKLYVLAPREWYGEKNDCTEFSPALIRHAIEHGREVAADPSKWVWPPP